MPVELRPSSADSTHHGEQGFRRWSGAAFKVALALLLAVAIWRLLWPAGRNEPTAAGPVQQLLVPASILVIAGLVALRCERHWAGPIRRFVRLLPEIRAGQGPIEELSHIGGALRPAVPLVQDLLREIRQQKQALAELDHEMRQRVAVRTDALERKIGTLLQQAARDGLTGLYNRRMLEQLLPKLIERCRMEGIDLCALMIDIDYFKQLNDTLGHAAGDELLRNVAGVITSSLRECDLAVRYGGDEFVILMPGAGAETAQALLNRLVSLVDALSKPLRVSNPPRLSIGMSQLSQLGGAGAAELIVAADRSLYDVKAARRTAPRPSAAGAEKTHG